MKVPLQNLPKRMLKMAHVISVINQKGGVAKTITTAHLAVALAKKKHRILCLDLDPQANLSFILGDIPLGHKPQTSIYDALKPNSTQSLNRTYLDTAYNNIRLCYGSLQMSGFEMDLYAHLDPSRVLRNKLVGANLAEDFDFILIDCPPSLSSITTNALCASDFFILPIAAGDSLALEGVDQLNTVISSVRTQLNPNLTLLGAVLTKYDARLNIAKAIVEETTTMFQTMLFKTRIRQNTLLEQSTHQKTTVFDVDPRAPSAKDYVEFAKEVVARIDMSIAQAEALNTSDAGVPVVENNPTTSVI